MDDLRNENCFDQQRKGFKIAYLMSKKDDFARPARFTRSARASYDYHVSVLCKTTTTTTISNDQINGFPNRNPNVR